MSVLHDGLGKGERHPKTAGGGVGGKWIQRRTDGYERHENDGVNNEKIVAASRSDQILCANAVVERPWCESRHFSPHASSFKRYFWNKRCACRRRAAVKIHLSHAPADHIRYTRKVSDLRHGSGANFRFRWIPCARGKIDESAMVTDQKRP